MDQEQETGVCPSCGYPAHAGHGPQCAVVAGSEVQEREQSLSISRVSPDDQRGVEEFLRFEVDQGFTTMVGSQTFEQKLALRQGQVSADKLRVATAKEGDEVVATSEIVLVNGTKGKQVGADEAWASGTLVAPQKRGAGIGEKMAAWQDDMARDAGKKFILTGIAQHNHPSLRLRMKVGYELEDVVGDPDAGEIDFTLRKDLSQPPAGKDWAKEVLDGRAAAYRGAITEQTPEQLLIDPEDADQVRSALQSGYRGKFLLRPEDFTEEKKIDKNFIVFVRTSEPRVKP